MITTNGAAKSKIPTDAPATSSAREEERVASAIAVHIEQIGKPTSIP